MELVPKESSEVQKSRCYVALERFGFLKFARLVEGGSNPYEHLDYICYWVTFVGTGIEPIYAMWWLRGVIENYVDETRDTLRELSRVLHNKQMENPSQGNTNAARTSLALDESALTSVGNDSVFSLDEGGDDTIHTTLDIIKEHMKTLTHDGRDTKNSPFIDANDSRVDINDTESGRSSPDSSETIILTQICGRIVETDRSGIATEEGGGNLFDPGNCVEDYQNFFKDSSHLEHIDDMLLD